MSGIAYRPNQPPVPGQFIPHQGLNMSKLESFFSGVTKSGFKGFYELTQSWDESTSQVKVLNKLDSSKARMRGEPSFFENLQHVALTCIHEAKEGYLFGAAPIQALRPDADAQIHACKLVFNKNKDNSHNLHDFLAGQQYTQAQRVELVKILFYLLTDKHSEDAARTILEGHGAQKLKELLSPGSIRNLKGTLWENYSVEISNANADILKLFHPHQKITATGSAHTFEASCRHSGYSSPAFPELTDCYFELDGKKTLEFVSKPSGYFKILSNDPKAITDWKEAFRQEGMITSSRAPYEKGQEKLTIYQSISSLLPSLNFSLPSNDDIVSTLLIPLGLGISVLGLKYAKENYEHEKKSTMRKAVGCVVGVATAILGIGVAAIPLDKAKI